MLKYCLLFLLMIGSSLHAAEDEKEAEKPAEESEETAETTPEPEMVLPTREQQVAEQIEKNLRSGEAIWLGAEDKKFLAIYQTDSSRETQGAIILLHDMGANAAWPQLISPLRLEMAKKGWHTLSLQLPMADTAVDKKTYLKDFDEAVLRVESGLQFLKQKNVTNTVIVGHGLGAAVGLFYLTKNPQSPVAAFTAISMVGEMIIKPDPITPSPETEEVPPAETDEKKAAEDTPEKEKDTKPVEPSETPNAEPPIETEPPEEPLPERELFTEMSKISMPFLDIYAQQDHQDVIREASKRMENMRSSDNDNYSQWQVDGTDHYFRGHEAHLIKRLRGWLKKHAEGMELTIPKR